MTNAKKHYDWIDWAKVILIYLMVVGHAFPADWLQRPIYSFHMPAFFLISGMLYHEHHWLRTLKSFGVPLIVFSLVNFIIWLLPKIPHGVDFSGIAERVFVPYWGSETDEVDYLYLFPGCWFVFALLFGRMLMGDIPLFRKSRNVPLPMISILCAYLLLEQYLFPANPLVSYKFYRVVSALPFLFFGYSLRERNLVESISGKVCALLFVIYIVASELQGLPNMLNLRWGVCYPLFFIVAIVGSLSLFSFCHYLPSNQIVGVLSKGTLFVLAFNFNILVTLRILCEKLGIGWVTSLNTLYAMFAGVIALVICYWPIKFLLKYCPVLLGK